jgi:hypothetical protein
MESAGVDGIRSGEMPGAARRLVFQGFGFALSLLVAVSSVYLVYRLTLQSPTVLRWHPYSYSDLLINYGQGFVRRGLFGSCVLAYAKGGSALAATNFILFWNFATLTVCMVVLACKRAPMRFWNAVFVLAIPGGLLDIAVTGEFLPKREMLFYCQLALTGLAVSAVQSMKAGRARRYAACCGIGWIFGCSVVLSLVHEAFLFMAAAANFFLLVAFVRAIPSSQEGGARRTSSLWLLYLAGVLSLFLVQGHFHGNANAVQRMWDGLSQTDRFTISPDGALSGGMYALRTSPWTLLNLSYLKAINGGAWYWLVPMFGLALYCLSLVALNEKARVAERESGLYRWAVCYLTLAVCAAPLFVLGWDWGRWINAINWSFLVVWLSVRPENLVAIGYGRGPRLLPATEEQPPWFRERWKPGLDMYLRFVRRYPVAVMAVLFLFAMTFRLQEVFASDTQGYLVGPAFHLLHHGLMRLFRL